MSKLSTHGERIIMHDQCLDVALLVHKETEDDTHFEFIGSWINLGYTGKPWVVDTMYDVIRVPKEAIHRWVDITAYHNKVRDRSGIPDRGV